MERRATQRSTYMSRTEIAWQDGNRELKMPAMIENRSSFGLGIAVPQPIPEGSSCPGSISRPDGSRSHSLLRSTAARSLIGFSFEREQSDGPEPSWQDDGTPG